MLSFSLENLATLWREIFLQPLLTAALLLTSVKMPQQVEQALKFFSQNPRALPILKAGFKVLIGLGTLYRVNKYLSKRALNNHIRDSWDWRKEIILITGGSSGIGELMVRKFAKLGIKVIAVDLKPPSKPFPVGVTFSQLDLTDVHAIREHSQKIREEVGHPTVLINNAGIGAGMSILDEPVETIRRTFDVNIIAHFHLVKEFLPRMIKRDHGHIVTLASVASFITLASNVDYSCTKTAALAFHEGLAQELRHRYDATRVRTTVIHPTWIRTPLIDELLRKPGFNDIVLEPETVAETVVKQVLRGESAQIVLPGRLSWLLTTLRGFPSWLQEGVKP
ncbi:hypothetical protein IFM53868_09561 [Aspergillus udagawae]|uniref:Estradiol 17-beta-dehydrogenase 11 n=1 Tax=Aspergillus udagawae TaxID=91492 RepID=A0ABQ1BBT4_9EURO|nr:hypothetical protein IFM53868_09561 [Aspergillus udagawae]